MIPSPIDLTVSWEQLSERYFGVQDTVLLEALLMSPNARGYLLGSLTELLLRTHLETLGYQVLRIKEKWVGEKKHHGDFYVSVDGSNWFVVESKGLKSNSERWHGIAEVPRTRAELEAWFQRKRGGEIKAWWERLSPGRKERILASEALHHARILETHFVSGTGGRAERAIATPRKSEFHVIAIDLYLRTGKHDFAFASSQDLPAPPTHPQHLKQNYLLDIMVPGVDETPMLLPPWETDFHQIFPRLQEPVNPQEMQIDLRKPGRREAEEDTSQS